MEHQLECNISEKVKTHPAAHSFAGTNDLQKLQYITSHNSKQPVRPSTEEQESNSHELINPALSNVVI
ncbi:hypothetical protein KIN20_020704 [Parelaphostrongylus tenuis]|uniref:Uncharacterized protein n=1 Tax=Parelaphostrongylus tenuis TaxID=148309 RepID=A0AAD5QVQ1_PARTN|nr:hypothetical protein KIN20_020704 [Parelaphostrongylus tenuis]